jgi:DNA-binding transcriptional ArsR family regulator
LSANLIFTADGLEPFEAFDDLVPESGEITATAAVDGVEFEVEAYAQESGLRPRDGDGDVREFRVRFEELGDGVTERSGAFHIAPRWPNMESKGDGPNPSTPDIEGVNVRVDASNLDADVYPELLRRSTTAVGLDGSYFEESKIHDYSNVFRFERYVRVDRDKSEQLIGTGGPLQQIFERVRTASKFRELREDDRGLEGYHHRVRFDGGAASRLIDDHRLGKQIKHYHPEHTRDDGDDPLYHPKVGVSLESSLTDAVVRWSDRDDLRGECDELLINLLSWAGLSTRSGETFVEDAYFSATESVHELRLVENPLPEIKRKQEATVVDGLTANPELCESDRDVLDVLADGGSATVEELGTEVEYSERTVYRVLSRLGELLSVDGGRVRFASEFIQSTVRTTLSEAKEAIESFGGSGDGASPFKKWANAHGVEVRDAVDARLELRFGRVPRSEDMAGILREGLRKWVETGRDRRTFKIGRARYRQEGHAQVRTPIFRD